MAHGDNILDWPLHSGSGRLLDGQMDNTLVTIDQVGFTPSTMDTRVHIPLGAGHRDVLYTPGTQDVSSTPLGLGFPFEGGPPRPNVDTPRFRPDFPRVLPLDGDGSLHNGPPMEHSRVNFAPLPGSPDQPMTKRERPCIYPEKYSGKICFEDYLKQFHIIAQINAWSDGDKCAFLLAMLQHRAQEFANDLPDHIRLSFAKLCDALLQQFGAHRLVDSYRHELLHCVQAKDEKFRDLGIRIRRLVSRAFPSTSFEGRESLGVYHFINAIKDPLVRIQVRRAGPQTLEQTIECAMRETDIQYGEKVKNQPRFQVAVAEPVKYDEIVQQLKDQVSAMEKELKKFRNAESKQGKTVTCWYCDKAGHCKYSCPEFQKNSPAEFTEYVHKRNAQIANKQAGN